MKTAIQELIEAIELITKKFKRELSNEEILDMCSNQLDKEKEQICVAYVDGLSGLYMASEEYYKKTYNQN